MSNVKLVSPEETVQLISEGYTYVDVRSEPEFEAGHVPGALNVPLNMAGPAGMVPNPQFLGVLDATFGKDAKLVVGCKMGGRSAKAAAAMSQAGYTNICDMTTGFDGKRDAFGRLTPGWNAAGRPVETGNTPGQSYADVKQRSGV